MSKTAGATFLSYHSQGVCVYNIDLDKEDSLLKRVFIDV